MQKLLLLCGAVLLSSVAAVAQSDISTIAAPSPATALPASALPASPQGASRPDLTDWQLSFGYEFTRLNMPSQSVGTYTLPAFTANDNGFDVSFTRFFGRWAGIEAESAAGFGSGSVPQISSAESLFLGGGPRFAYRGRRFEPWVHTLIGLEHFSFTQTSVAYGSNNTVAFLGGGGVDFHLNVRTAIRVQADYLGTRLFSEGQSNFQIGGGVVFNF
jgi:hypothetical protein